jgi:hypothetical protein
VVLIGKLKHEHNYKTRTMKSKTALSGAVNTKTGNNPPQNTQRI